MQRSRHTPVNNTTWVSFLVIYLGSAEVFQNSNNCFKAFLYYSDYGISWSRETRNPEVMLTWTMGNCNAECRFRLIQHRKTGTYSVWASNVCREKRWLRGDLIIVVFIYLLEDYEKRESDSCHRCTVKGQEVTYTSCNKEILNGI